jgi:hypothetical protein
MSSDSNQGTAFPDGSNSVACRMHAEDVLDHQSPLFDDVCSAEDPGIRDPS